MRADGARDGSVAEEASLLVDAAASWLAGFSAPADTRTGQEHPSGYAAAAPHAAPAGAQDETAADQAAGAHDRTFADQDPSAAGAERPGDGGTQRCTGCPLCRGRTFLEHLGADTFDDLADLVSAVADSLRAMAESRRTSAPADQPPGEQSPGKASGDRPPGEQPPGGQH